MLKKHRIVRFVNLKVTFLKTKSEANICLLVLYSPECCQRTHHWYLNSLEKDNARVSFRKTFVLVPFLTLCGGSNQPKLLYFVILFHFI